MQAIRVRTRQCGKPSMASQANLKNPPMNLVTGRSECSGDRSRPGDRRRIHCRERRRRWDKGDEGRPRALSRSKTSMPAMTSDHRRPQCRRPKVATIRAAAPWPRRKRRARRPPLSAPAEIRDTDDQTVRESIHQTHPEARSPRSARHGSAAAGRHRADPVVRTEIRHSGASLCSFRMKMTFFPHQIGCSKSRSEGGPVQTGQARGNLPLKGSVPRR